MFKLKFSALVSFCYMFMAIHTTSLHALELKSDEDSILRLGMEMSNMRNMLKAYILIGAKIDYKNPHGTLSNGLVAYEDLLDALQTKYPDPEILTSIQKSKTAWVHVKGAMETALRKSTLEEMKSGAIFIHGNIRTVIKELAAMKKHLLLTSEVSDKESLDASIEIAASARRLSAHYMMDLWHLDDPTIDVHWNKGLAIYGRSLEILKKSSYMNNKKFRSHFRNCKKLHTYFTKMGEKPKMYSILIDKKADVSYKHAKEMTKIILSSN